MKVYHETVFKLQEFNIAVFILGLWGNFPLPPPKKKIQKSPQKSTQKIVFVKLYASVHIVIIFKMNYAKIDFLSISGVILSPASAPGPDLPLLFKLHDIRLVVSRENH